MGGDTLVAHHAAFDIAMVEMLVTQETGQPFVLHNPRLDTAHLARKIENGNRSADMVNHSHYSLDRLCKRFDITMYDRHTAWGDALITAKLLLKLKRKVREHNPPVLRSLGM